MARRGSLPLGLLAHGRLSPAVLPWVVGAVAYLGAPGSAALATGSRATTIRKPPTVRGKKAASAAATFDSQAFWREPANLPLSTQVLETGSDDEVQWEGVVYTSEIYRGEPMRVFAYFVWPADKAERTGGAGNAGPAAQRYPGMVDIHGGGWKADLDRAKEFARAGYACLSYDWNTYHDPVSRWKRGDPAPSKPFTVFGTLRYDSWRQQFIELGEDGKRPALYRAVMAARRGLSWLATRPEVDRHQLVVHGHSWGGLLAQLVAGIDRRPKAVISSAAAGGWQRLHAQGLERTTKPLTPRQMAEWTRRYDPAAYAHRITAPILVRHSASDDFGSIDMLARYWALIKAPKSLELLPAANHTFDDVPTRVAWANQWLRSGPAFPTVRDLKLTHDGSGTWTVRVQAAGDAEKAAFAWTTSPGAWKFRSWNQRPLTGSGGLWTATFRPANYGGALRVFASVRDASGRVTSCLPVVATMPKGAVAGPPNGASVPVVNATVLVGRTALAPDEKPDAWSRARPVGPLSGPRSVLGEGNTYLDTLYDDQALYLRLRMSDPTPWLPGPRGAEWWSGDSVHLRLRTDSRATEGGVPAAEQNVVHLGWYPDQETGAVRVHVIRGRDLKGAASDGTGITASVDVQSAAGYTLVARMPWTALDPGFSAAEGRALRFALSVNGGDLLTDESLGLLSFNHADLFRNPDAWGQAVLSSAS